jgi:membrane protein YqaA with SNARE-associated domain
MLEYLIRSRSTVPSSAYRPDSGRFPNHLLILMNFEALSLWLRNTLLPYGGFGLMVLAMCDSSFFSLPEINDVLLMTFAINEPGSMVKFVLLTTLGSLIGCALLYSVGRKGGDKFLRKTFADERLAKVQSWYQRHGILAVIIPSLLPPPTPFKIFVLSAGTFGISWPKFLIAIVIGRSIRYFSEGILAVMYGPAAIEFVQRNYGKLGLAMVAVIVLSVIVFFSLGRRRAPSVEA